MTWGFHSAETLYETKELRHLPKNSNRNTAKTAL